MKAILAHLMHCITHDTKASGANEEVVFRPRAMSVHQVAQSQGKVQVSEEVNVDILYILSLRMRYYCLLLLSMQPTNYIATAVCILFAIFLTVLLLRNITVNNNIE